MWTNYAFKIFSGAEGKGKAVISSPASRFCKIYFLACFEARNEAYFISFHFHCFAFHKRIWNNTGRGLFYHHVLYRIMLLGVWRACLKSVVDEWTRCSNNFHILPVSIIKE